MKIKRNNYKLNIREKSFLYDTFDLIIKRGVFINGPIVKDFEKKFSKKIGSLYCAAFSSSSTAISSIMNILSKNEEILIPAFSPIPVAAALKNYNLNIRYVDVDKETFLMRSDLENFVSKKTRVIMPVHLFGNVFDVDALKKKINRTIHIIEDASQAHFSKINNNFAGCSGLASIFSFYPTKNLNAYGDAGCIITRNSGLIKKLKSYRNYGLHPKKDLLVNFGNNFRMDEIQAKILLINLRNVIQNNQRRSSIAKNYINQLKFLPLSFQKIKSNVTSNHHAFSILIEPRFRDKLNLYLRKSGIDTAIYYKKLLPSMTEKFSDLYLKNNYPNSYFLSKRIINLPINPFLSIKEINYICKKISMFFR